MKIASANLQMTATHSSVQQYAVSESLKMWVGTQDSRPAGERPQHHHQATAGDNVTLSAAGQAASQAAATEDNQTSSIDNDPKLRLIRQMLEFLTGRRITVFDARDIQATATQPATAPASPPSNTEPPRQQTAGYGVEYDRHASYTETEQTNFAASGKVVTADGKEISFNLQLSMSRFYHEESSTSLRLGDAASKTTDPLVLNFSGTAAQLTDQRFAFDLNNDGSQEQINFVAPGSGFLAFDRNGDGKINNGSELFGPTSGDGFQELATLDKDKNGWIDENDAAFNQLSVWTRDKNGKDTIQSLAAAGVGAIALSRVATPFELKTNTNELVGQIRTSGIFLQEQGSAGTIQQIDLTA
jgi:hypothetical protein